MIMTAIVMMAAIVMMVAVIVAMVVQSEFQFVFPCVKSFSSSESDDRIAVVFGSITFL